MSIRRMNLKTFSILVCETTDTSITRQTDGGDAFGQ